MWPFSLRPFVYIKPITTVRMSDEQLEEQIEWKPTASPFDKEDVNISFQRLDTPPPRSDGRSSGGRQKM